MYYVPPYYYYLYTTITITITIYYHKYKYKQVKAGEKKLNLSKKTFFHQKLVNASINGLKVPARRI